MMMKRMKKKNSDEADDKQEAKPYTRPNFLRDLQKVTRRLGPDEQSLKKPKGRRRSS